MKESESLLPDYPDVPPLEEAPIWNPVRGTWNQIFGNFHEKGLSIEWHDFSNEEEFDWAKSFHPGSLEICLNFSGQARLQSETHTLELLPEQIALYTTTGKRLEAARFTGHMHRFFTIEISADYLKREFASEMGGLRPEIVRFIENTGRAESIMEVLPMSTSLMVNRIHLLDPPVNRSAVQVWYDSKVKEILSHLLFKDDKPAELLAQKQLRNNRERCDRVLFLLERDLENPPSLEMLAKEVQCSPFYLSRLFAQQAGMSIPKYLRLKRIEKAGEYLKSGNMNVTEAAMAVGYSSLSAFNKAFVEQMGVCPGLYPLMKARPKKIK